MTRNVATCHPQAKYYALGFCRPCYDKDWRAKNPEVYKEVLKRERHCRAAKAARFKGFNLSYTAINTMRWHGPKLAL